jgi:hypothetical protein
MSRFYIKDADFKLFTALWNQREGRTTPALHFQMADWLEWNWKKKNTRLLMMAFRASGKSTMVGLFAAWLLYTNPDLRILVIAADHVLAEKMVTQVKKIIERHPLTKKMKPDKADQWASDRFTVNRMTQLRDPSMLARGITSNITGTRADIIICDDVEVPNTCETAPKREDLKARLSETDYVLVPDGTQIFVGTPHTFYSIYKDKDPFLKDYTRLSVPLLNENGESAWPEKFTDYEIDRLRKQTGPNKFSSQMLLKFLNITDGRLDPSLMPVYGDDLDYVRELQTLFIGKKKMASVSAWWDPAYGAGSGDNSVLAILYSDEEGYYYLHNVSYIKVTDHSVDMATAQCRIVARLARDHFLPSLTVESNGIGKFLPGLLRNETALSHTPCSVIEASNRKPKDVRILEAFDALLAAGRIRIHQSVLKTPFMTEMQEWRPGSHKVPDDGLDAVAGALAQQPVRLKRLYTQGQHNWMKGSTRHQANTDFEV